MKNKKQEKYLGGRGDAEEMHFMKQLLICCGVVIVTQLGVADLNCKWYRMKPANSPVISTSWSLNQALSSRAAAFVTTAMKHKNPSLKLIFQFQVPGAGEVGLLTDWVGRKRLNESSSHLPHSSLNALFVSQLIRFLNKRLNKTLCD